VIGEDPREGSAHEAIGVHWRRGHQQRPHIVAHPAAPFFGDGVDVSGRAQPIACRGRNHSAFTFQRYESRINGSRPDLRPIRQMDVLDDLENLISVSRLLGQEAQHDNSGVTRRSGVTLCHTLDWNISSWYKCPRSIGGSRERISEEFVHSTEREPF